MKYDDYIWVTKTNERLFVKNMTDNHIQNAYHALCNKLIYPRNDEKRNAWINIFKTVIRYRKFKKLKL